MATALLTVYIIANYEYQGRYKVLETDECRNRTKEETEYLLSMTYTVHEILNRMEIPHWLCYGSVFGALRISGPLPWDNDVDICLDGDSLSLSEIPSSKFISVLRDAGFRVTDNWLQRRGYRVMGKDPKFSAFGVDLLAFFRYGEWMKRTGWEPWLTFIHYDKHHKFPSRLVRFPLPRVQFGTRRLPLPQGGMEIQMYFYPNDWNKIVKPKECQDYTESNGQRTSRAIHLLAASGEKKKAREPHFIRK